MAKLCPIWSHRWHPAFFMTLDQVCQFFFHRTFFAPAEAGLPDGLFSNQKSQFG
jgi:hypothetical protein